MMNALELRSSLGLAGVYALRMFGMFLILPVFALYAQHLEGTSQTIWIGIALGSYGLTQALLQLPFGMLSDRIGRKKVIYFGLILFAIGSFIAADADHIITLTIGRIIQGAGAISAAITALLADLTREENRTKAMAIIGMSIGTTFAASLVLGPILAHWIGVNGIFALTGTLSILAILWVKFFVPNPTQSRFHSDAEAKPGCLKSVLNNKELLRLNFGIFALHGAQMAMFVVMPFALINLGHIDKAHHWEIYLPVTLAGFFLMIPAIIIGEKKAKLKEVFIFAIGLMLLAQLGMAFYLNSLTQIIFWLVLYFIAFNILEACLPSLISKIAPVDSKGTAIGVYNTAQSLGLFLGALMGGLLFQHYGSVGVFGFTSIVIFIWLSWAVSMKRPRPVKTVMFHIGDNWQENPTDLSQKLARLNGVEEAIVLKEEKVAYLKVAQQGWDEAGVKQIIQETA